MKQWTEIRCFGLRNKLTHILIVVDYRECVKIGLQVHTFVAVLAERIRKSIQQSSLGSQFPSQPCRILFPRLEYPQYPHTSDTNSLA